MFANTSAASSIVIASTSASVCPLNCTSSVASSNRSPRQSGQVTSSSASRLDRSRTRPRPRHVRQVPALLLKLNRLASYPRSRATRVRANTLRTKLHSPSSVAGVDRPDRPAACCETTATAPIAAGNSKSSHSPGGSGRSSKAARAAGSSTSCISVDLPDPLTPDSPVMRASGISTSTACSVRTDAPRSRTGSANSSASNGNSSSNGSIVAGTGTGGSSVRGGPA